MTNARVTVYTPARQAAATKGGAPQRRPRLNTTLTNIRSQIQHKESQGRALSEIEQHISKKISRQNLKPSISSALFAAGRTLFGPGVIVALSLVCVTLLVGRSPRTAAAKADQPAVSELPAEGQGGVEAAAEFRSQKADDDLNTVIASVKDSARVKLFGYATLEAEPAAVEPPEQTAALQPAPAPQAADPDLARRQGLIKFLAGMIAVHHPDIADCGSVARDIVEISTKEKIDPFFVASIISVESRFFTDARSKVGATGLMQLMPGTAAAVAASRKAPTLTDPHTNIMLGVQYIKELELKYRGNRYLALSAYNWGPANVDKGTRIPASVSQYATKIMERTARWRKHFTRAEASATALNLTGAKAKS